MITGVIAHIGAYNFKEKGNYGIFHLISMRRLR